MTLPPDPECGHVPTTEWTTWAPRAHRCRTTRSNEPQTQAGGARPRRTTFIPAANESSSRCRNVPPPRSRAARRRSKRSAGATRTPSLVGLDRPNEALAHAVLFRRALANTWRDIFLMQPVVADRRDVNVRARCRKPRARSAAPRRIPCARRAAPCRPGAGAGSSVKSARQGACEDVDSRTLTTSLRPNGAGDASQA